MRKRNIQIIFIGFKSNIKTVIYKKDSIMNSYAQFKLQSNPFRLTPALSSEELIWAGFPELKKRIENRILKAIKIPNSSLILNWGDYGSGKTHAARYFTNLNVLSNLKIKTDSLPLPLPLIINFPRSKEPVKEIYTQIIDKIDIDDIRRRLEKEKIDIASVLSQVTDNVLIQNIVSLLLNPTVSPQMMKSYLYGTASITSNFVDKNVSRKLVSDIDYIELLSALFSVITYDKKAYSCVIIWIDEFESISILNTVSISNVNNLIRSLLDYVPNNLLIFLNLTQSAMMDVSDLSDYLQEAVKSRIKDKIELGIPDLDAFKLYLKELLNDPLYRTSECSDKPYFPFEEDVIDQIFNDLGGSVSLRRYNDAFSLLLDEAMIENVCPIDLNFYTQKKNEIIID